MLPFRHCFKLLIRIHYFELEAVMDLPVGNDQVAGYKYPQALPI